MKKLALALVLCTAAFADKTLVYEIPNMACVSCYEVITQTLNKLKGVKKFDVNLEAKTADIVVEDDFAENTVVEALKKQGYQAVLKSEK
ncbi:heavy metal-associated domain protein [Campylobacter showae]|uniref:Heavy metal-associated domain protein n=1 Tax=Campylobacter showae RM3277 TaxID=553219 RepID=C6RIY3_9BACT|nr:heavy-metal-associated domain-containing protein [Campylobacter showae]EET78564.1 heavy metal-associated domain protein [Campylobacter showae RM3277]QCD49907.1 heavy metal-associated domain protein [Campylobacter showae]